MEFIYGIPLGLTSSEQDIARSLLDSAKARLRRLLNNMVMGKCKSASKWLEDKEEGQSILYIVNVR